MDSFDQKQELEKEFCRDFSCCGLNLSNLHQLLEHYEEYHLSRNGSNGSNSEDDERDQHISSMRSTINNNKNNPSCFLEEDLLLPQPMQLAQLALASNTTHTATKEHLTNSDLNMLENAQKYTATTSVQTLDSIVDGLNTPSLSPSDSSGFHNDHFFDENVSENGNWGNRGTHYNNSSHHSNNSEGKK